MWVEELLVNDEISPEEEGFLMGYMDLDEQKGLIYFISINFYENFSFY